MAPAPAAVVERPRPPRENIWLALICNAAYPALVLSLLSKEERLGPTWGLIVAVVVPIAYGLNDLLRNRRWNVFAILGVVSTLLTGGFGLMKLSGTWFAVKEAAVPLVLGLAVPLSMRTRQPLVRTLLFNDQILDTKRIEMALEEQGQQPAFQVLLGRTSWLVASSFFLSAVLNFFLALFILKSPSGTAEFNAELGKLTALSYPVIMVPSMAILMFGIWKLLTGVEKLTGLSGDDLFHKKPTESPAKTPDAGTPDGV
ncbi:MAG: MFS transporter [Verrucomicrobiales bacterium]|nr:MFS transporter [Verrucomicrobiales bacterium]MCP5528580.1 MFS transporter [Verrucomicrobiales bacterium]